MNDNNVDSLDLTVETLTNELSNVTLRSLRGDLKSAFLRVSSVWNTATTPVEQMHVVRLLHVILSWKILANGASVNLEELGLHVWKDIVSPVFNASIELAPTFFDDAFTAKSVLLFWGDIESLGTGVLKKVVRQQPLHFLLHAVNWIKRFPYLRSCGYRVLQNFGLHVAELSDLEETLFPFFISEIEDLSRTPESFDFVLLSEAIVHYLRPKAVRSAKSSETIFPILARLFVDQIGGPRVIFNLMLSLCHLAEISEYVDAVLAFDGLVDRIFDICQTHGDVMLVDGALRIIGNIVGGNDTQTEEIVRRGVVELYASLAVHGSHSYAREILWGMSNVAAGTLPQATLVVDAGFIDIGIEYLKNAQSSIIARESGWLLSNLLVSNIPDIIPTMVEKGIIELFLTTLVSFGTQDLKFVPPLVEGLYKVVVHGNSFSSNPYDERIVAWFEQHGDEELLDVMTYMEEEQHQKMQAVVSRVGYEPVFEDVDF